MIATLRSAMARLIQGDRLEGRIRFGSVRVPDSTVRTETTRALDLGSAIPKIETFTFHWRDRSPFGFSAAIRSTVLIALEVRPAGWLHRARLQRTRRMSPASMGRFVRAVTLPGGLFEADRFEPEVFGSYRSFVPLQRLGGRSSGEELYPVTRLVEIIHRWWGAHHRADRAVVDFDGLLAEFCFYFNRRRRKNRDSVREELVQALLAPQTALSPGALVESRR